MISFQLYASRRSRIRAKAPIASAAAIGSGLRKAAARIDHHPLPRNRCNARPSMRNDRRRMEQNMSDHAKINRQWKREWIKALRSKKYRQGQQSLREQG